MEEKERYEWNSRFDEAIKDNQTGDIVNAVEVLNQQDKRIKELEEELVDAKRDYIPKLEFGLQRANKMGRDAENENQQLKQQLLEYQEQSIRDNQNWIEETTQLKQQLAEKDKKIETILKENEELVIKHNVYNWGDKIQKDKVYSLTGEALELLINRQNQKAIEQLEKVKDIILNERKITSFNFDIFNKGKDTALFWLNEQINNQINELKGKVEE